MTPELLALGWCAVAGWGGSRVCAALGSRVEAVRARVLVPSKVSVFVASVWIRTTTAPGVRSVMRVGRGLVRLRRSRRRTEELERAIPLVVDLISVGVGAGTSLLQAVELAHRWAPPVARDELEMILQRVGYGALLPDALAAQSKRSPVLRSVTETLASAVRLGSPLQPTLARIGAEYRTSVARASAARARTVPVRLIFPLVFLVLPAFALVTVVPALVAGWHSI